MTASGTSVETIQTIAQYVAEYEASGAELEESRAMLGKAQDRAARAEEVHGRKRERLISVLRGFLARIEGPETAPAGPEAAAPIVVPEEYRGPDPIAMPTEEQLGRFDPEVRRSIEEDTARAIADAARHYRRSEGPR